MKKTESKIMLGIYIVLAALSLSLPVIFDLNLAYLRESTFTLPFNVFYALGIFTILVLLIVEIVARFVNHEAKWQSLAITIGLSVLVLTSNDALRFLASFRGGQDLPYAIKMSMAILNYFAFSATLVFYASFTFSTYFKSADPRFFPAIAGFLSICGLMSSILYFLNLQIITFGLITAGVIFFQVHTMAIAYSRGKLPLDMLAVYIISLDVCMLEFTQVVEHSGYDVFFPNGTSSVLAICILILYLIVYLNFALYTTRKARLKEESDKRVDELQANILKNQVDPHFIFNALNVIKSLYRIDLDRGEKALDLLSKNLRSYTRAAGQKLVSLEKELQIVSDYVELENMKFSKPIEVIYDIEEYDYEVPVFSLEPLIENCIRYSGITSKEDGFIEIRSVEVKGGHLLSVADNGKGFDVNKVGTDSYGMRNVKERFEILLHAKVTIESKVGEGAKVTIFIPMGEDE